MNWDFLQNINWEAILTAILTSTVFQGVMTFVFKQVLQKIGMKADLIDTSAKDIGKNVPKIIASQENINDKVYQIGEVIEKNILADKELGEKYTQLGNVLINKLELLEDFKDTLDKFIKEE